jgi:putative aldouronate transport system permease protein
MTFLSPTWGVVNALITKLGGEPIFFLAERAWFRPIVVMSTVWRETGWGTIIYLAAISGVGPELYEAAIIDGAGRFRRAWSITLPSILSTILILLILRIGRTMSNGFEQIFVLQNPLNLRVSEVFETYVYRVGLLGGRFAFATAVGLFQSVVGMIMLIGANALSKSLGEEGLY